MKNLETGMKVAAASVFCLYLKTHHVHFNIEGPDFYQNHKMLDKIYKDIWESFDGFGEQMRALDIYAPASLSEFHMLSVVEDSSGVRPAIEMLRELLIDNDKVIGILNQVNALCSNHVGLQNFIQTRVDAHEKWGWMLRATVHQ